MKKIIIKLNKLQASPTSKMDGTRLPSTPWPFWTLDHHVSYLTEHLQYRFTQLPWILLHSAQQVSASKMHRRGILKSAVNNNTTGNKRTAVQPACYCQPQSWKPAENSDWKIREIEWLYCCQQQFDKFLIWGTFNHKKRKLCKSAENCLKKFMKPQQVNLFVADFNHLEPLSATAATFNSRSAAYGLNGNLIFIYQRSFKLPTWRESISGAQIPSQISQKRLHKVFNILKPIMAMGLP